MFNNIKLFFIVLFLAFSLAEETTETTCDDDHQYKFGDYCISKKENGDPAVMPSRSYLDGNEIKCYSNATPNKQENTVSGGGTITYTYSCKCNDDFTPFGDYCVIDPPEGSKLNTEDNPPKYECEKSMPVIKVVLEADTVVYKCDCKEGEEMTTDTSNTKTCTSICGQYQEYDTENKQCKCTDANKHIDENDKCVPNCDETKENSGENGDCVCKKDYYAFGDYCVKKGNIPYGASYDENEQCYKCPDNSKESYDTTYGYYCKCQGEKPYLLNSEVCISVDKDDVSLDCDDRMSCECANYYTYDLEKKKCVYQCQIDGMVLNDENKCVCEENKEFKMENVYVKMIM